MSDEETQAAETTITAVPNGWHLVEHGTWQISVGPDGVIRLPLHLSHDDVPDFVAAITAAADHASNVASMLKANSPADSAPVRTMMASPSGTTPAGYTKVHGQPHNPPLRGSIGRRGGTLAQTRGLPPSVPAPPMPPHPGK